MSWRRVRRRTDSSSFPLIPPPVWKNGGRSSDHLCEYKLARVLTLFHIECSEEFKKVELCLTQLCLRDSCLVSFSSPGEVTSNQLVFHPNGLKSALVSSHWAAVAPGLPPRGSSDHPHGDRGVGEEVERWGRTHAWACYLLHQHVETDRKTSVLETFLFLF